MHSKTRASRTPILVAGALLSSSFALVGPAGSAYAAETGPTSVPGPSGQQLSSMADAAISADGRLVAFAGRAGDASGLHLYDRSARKTVRLDTTVAGRPLTGEFRDVAMSADGSRIVFTTGRFDTDEMPDPTAQVWLHDRSAGVTSLISATASGTPGNAQSEDPAISADGRVVAFTTHASDLAPGTAAPGSDVVVRDVATGRTENISGVRPVGAAEADSRDAALSADGRQVAFVSTQPNLVPGDAHDQADAFVRDRTTGKLWRASVPVDGRAGNVSEVSISADGNRVAFARVVVRMRLDVGFGAFVHDRRTGEIIRIDLDSEGKDLGYQISDPKLSADGRFVTFGAGGVSRESVRHSNDIFVRDLKFGSTREVSAGAAGLVEDSANTEAVISGDGRYVVFANETRANVDASLLGSSLWFSDLGPAPTTSSEALVNTYGPRIAMAGKKLRTRGAKIEVVEPGRWEPVLGMRLDYQWLRNGRVIKGATKKSYTLRKGDIGARLSVRESADVAGLPAAKVRSEALKVSRSSTYLGARAIRQQVRAGKPLTLKLRVRHYDGNAPQGNVKVIVGKRVLKTVKVDRDGKMRVKVRGIRPGSQTVKVRHTSTAFVKSGGTIKLQVTARRR